jgi:DNA-binding beta-propeller fold protein YncE
LILHKIKAMKKYTYLFLVLVWMSCKKVDETAPATSEETLSMRRPGGEDLSTYQEIASLNLGGLGAAEITCYDHSTKRLFAVNNGSINKIDVIDFSNPSALRVIHSIGLGAYGGSANSIDVYDGKLAVAIEASDKQANGKVVVFNTSNYEEIKTITVGALPDMITYTPDGKYILTANEGEPNDTYTNDPEGTVSIIKTANYTVETINFAAFETQLTELEAKGLRVFGPGKNFLKDIEPEYITVSEDSKTAWITLQENNAIAELNINQGIFTKIIPLGFKHYGEAGNEADISDRDGRIAFSLHSGVYGMYQPDAISFVEHDGVPYLFTANEGDAREYRGFSEMARVNNSAIKLDAATFPNAATLKTDAVWGRLNVTKTLGDIDNDGDFDKLYSLGTRSFSVWNAVTGSLEYDSKSELDRRAQEIGIYDDGRSDDKGVEPEAITIGRVGSKKIAIIGLERADAFAIYDITSPLSPVFIKMFKTGDAPEGVLFIPANKSPIRQSLIVVSSENDGFVKVYKANLL